MRVQSVNASRFYWSIQLMFAVFLGVVAGVVPRHNWDALGYVGCAIASSTSDATIIHHTSYDSLHRVPEFEKLTSGDGNDSSFIADWYSNQYHFTELLPFYSVKALFVVLILCLHRLGVPWAYTGPVISGIASVAIGVLIAFWLRRYVAGYRSTLLWLSVMLAPTVTGTARLFTPDALSCALAVFAAWLILEQEQYWWGTSVAVLTVWARPDYVLFVGILAFALWRIRKLSMVEAATIVGLALGSYLLIVQLAGNYGWWLLFRHSFMGYLKAPGEFVVHSSAVLRGYPHVLLAAIKYEVLDSFLLVYYALGGFLLLTTTLKREYKAVVATTLLFGIAHVAAFPSFQNRFFGAITIVVSMSFVAMRQSQSSPQYNRD